MRFRGSGGEEAWCEGGAAQTPESAALARDIAMVRLRMRGFSWRWIGLYLNAAHSTLKDRYDRMPAEDRERYERLGGLGI